ncbi:membrane protein insertion efficiency factor YidD [Salinispirillum marinum]|uniref:Membrane protein insertion efficiency factor YidD n=2 Tax=Saccharospirillaceae TaxID=255527 RepID=A0ABV8B9S6_9GAMM
MKTALLSLIRYYQRKGGGQYWFGIDCNYEPTCSAYTYQAIEKYGTWQGLKMGWHRIRRCNQPAAICKCIDPLE